MLGVTDVRPTTTGRPAAARARRGARRRATPTARRRVGVYLGEPGETRPRPVLRRRGPGPHRLHRAAGAAWSAARTGPRTRSSRTTCGSPSAAASTIDAGARRSSTSAPLGAPDGSDGYAVTRERTGAAPRPRPPDDHRAWRRRSPPARWAPTAAGQLPAQRLAAARLRPPRPPGAHQQRVDPRRHRARRRPRLHAAASRSAPSIYPDPDTHIETVTYGRAGGSMKRCSPLLVGDGTRVTRPLSCSAAIARHPCSFARAAVAAQLVAAHDHRARDADARQRDALRAEPRASAAVRLRPSRTREHPTRRSSPPPTGRPSGWPDAPAASRRAL